MLTEPLSGEVIHVGGDLKCGKAVGEIEISTMCRELIFA